MFARVLSPEERLFFQSHTIDFLSRSGSVFSASEMLDELNAAFLVQGYKELNWPLFFSEMSRLEGCGIVVACDSHLNFDDTTEFKRYFQLSDCCYRNS